MEQRKMKCTPTCPGLFFEKADWVIDGTLPTNGLWKNKLTGNCFIAKT